VEGNDREILLCTICALCLEALRKTTESPGRIVSLRTDNLLLLSHYSLCLFQASDFSFLLMDPLDIW
jgi:hypothetical protein